MPAYTFSLHSFFPNPTFSFYDTIQASSAYNQALSGSAPSRPTTRPLRPITRHYQVALPHGLQPGLIRQCFLFGLQPGIIRQRFLLAYNQASSGSASFLAYNQASSGSALFSAYNPASSGSASFFAYNQALLGSAPSRSTTRPNQTALLLQFTTRLYKTVVYFMNYPLYINTYIDE